MPANATLERDVSFPNESWGGRRLFLHVFEDGGEPKPVPWYLDATQQTEPFVYQLTEAKGLRAHYPWALLRVTPDRQTYALGETAKLSVSVENRIPVGWEGTLRVTRRVADEVSVLAERAVSLTGSGLSTLEIPISLPTQPNLQGMGLEFFLVRGSIEAARSGVGLRIVHPELRSLGLSHGPWSRTSSNPVTWSLENVGAVPLLAGSVRAQLTDEGATLWDESQPLVLGKPPDGRGSVSFAVPPIPIDLRSGLLTLTADNGSGPTMAARASVVAGLAASARPFAASYSSGESGEVEVTLANHGTLQEQGNLSGSIEGIGGLAPVAFSLSPAEKTVLRLPFLVPATAVGGFHRGMVLLPTGAGTEFTVNVRLPMVELSVEDRVYQPGERVGVRVRNTGGSATTSEVRVEVSDVTRATETVTVEPGAETRVLLPPLPAQLPSGTYGLSAFAVDARHGRTAQFSTSIAVSGTEATLTVATDREIYTSGSSIQASAQVTNASLALEAAGLHLEIATPCVPIEEGGTFHFETWDGTAWVERTARGRAAVFETDQVDLSPYWPDVDGEYKVRIRHAGPSLAYLDYVALVSSGALVAPTEARLEGVDVRALLVTSNDSGPYVAGRTVVVRFPAVASPSLLYRAREGEEPCFPFVLWQRDVPLEMSGGARRDVSEAVMAPFSPRGQFIFSGTVRTRNGEVLAWDAKTFEVIQGSLAVSVKTDATLYRRGAPVTVSGTLRNVGAGNEPAVSFSVDVQGRFCGGRLRTDASSLSAGESRDYTLSFVPEDYCPDEVLAVVARARSASAFAQSEAGFGTGTPELDVQLEVPDPAVSLARSSPSLVVANEADLDAVTKLDDGALPGTLPFAVVLDGVRYTGFRQSADGFLELVREGATPSGLGVSCLENSGPLAIVAGFLADLDPSTSGFVGYRRYPAGSADRAGRAFATDTLVFFWDAPARSDTRHNRFQVLLSEDGLIRADSGEIFAALSTPGVCNQAGLSLPPGRVMGFDARAPFGLRLEAGVGRSAFQGSIVVRNHGTYPGTASLDYGRAGGTRTLRDLTVLPGQTQTLSFQDRILGPTTYTLLATGDASVSLERAVSPSEGFLARYTGPSEFAPGLATLPFQLTKTGGVAGPVEVTFVLSAPSGSQTLSRTYDLEPGIPTGDFVTFDLTEGASTLSVAANVPASGGPFALRAAPQERVTFAAHAGAVSGGALPIAVDITNTGLADFSGEVQVEGIDGSRTPVSVPRGQTSRLELTASLAAASPGTASFVVRLVSQTGVVVGETTLSQEVVGPRVVLMESPEGATFDPAAPATLPFLLRNTGDQTGLGQFRFQVFDEDLGASFSLAPGADTDVVFQIRVDDDVEQKVYRGRYAIEVAGTSAVTGQVNFTVNGIALVVEAALDKDAYADGDTAHLTVNVTNDRPALGTNYLVRARYASFDEVRPLTVAASATIVFDIPLPRVTGEPVFLGITHPDGRSLYINTLHVRRADELATVSLDEQVYPPGGSVALTATTASAGTLTLAAPGYSETVNVSGPVSRSFTLPADLPGGTYFVSWTFTGIAGSGSGSVPFDVAGLRIRVFQATLDKGRYETGEAIQTTLQINTNQATSATLRAFILDPEGLSQGVGETTVALSPEADRLTTHAWPFESAIAGLHRLVYGIYQPGTGTLLASGSLAFDVGNAAVLGVRTDKAEYPLPDTPVEATVFAFVSGPASLRLEVDGQSMATPEVTGSGIVAIVATLSSVASGPHELVAVLEGGGYTSRAATTFSLGTSLPDLVPGLATGRPVSGASWKLDVGVSNLGRSEAPATQLTVRDLAHSAAIGTVEVPALMAGASTVVSVDWNVRGQAGRREVEVVADAAEAVREFREDNNRSLSLLEIPSLAINAVAAPSYPANVEAGLGASITNLTADTSYTGLTVSASVARPDATFVPLAPAPVPPLGPGATVAVGTPWLVGRSVPGTYVLQSRLVDESAATLGAGAALFEVLPTFAFAGTVTASPRPAVVGQALTLGGLIENEGNVAASGTARFELVAPDQSIAAHATTPADVPVDGSTNVAASIDPLSVQPGDYDLLLGMGVPDRLYPVARSPLTVSGPGVEATIQADLTPRVLVYVGGLPHDAPGVARRTAFVQASLAGTGVVLRVTSNPLEFAKLFRSGLWNTYVFMTDAPLLVRLLGDELREAVFRGDGLVFVPWKSAGAAHEIEPALGVKVDGPIPGQQHTLQVLDGPLGPAQTLLVGSPATRLELTGATLVGTIGSVPVLTVNSFGEGRDVTMAFDPAVPPQNPARAALQELFARAVFYAAPLQARVAAAGTVVPLAVLLENPGPTSQPIEVTLELSSGLRIAAVEDSPAAQDPPIWQLNLAAGGHRALRFRVVLPDQAGTFSIGSTVKVNGQAISNPPQVPLEVAQTTGDALAQVIADLHATMVAPGDRGHLQSAIALLHAAQALPADLLGLEGRIRLAAEAAEKLGRIQSADLRGPRGEVDRLIAAWERSSHELAAALGS